MGEYKGLSAEFRQKFRLVNDPAMLRAERLVTGGDYGASSYTTVNQANELAEILSLHTGRTLLDVGSGSGWPGNYLSASTGCSVVLTDPIIEGMAVAKERSRRDELEAMPVVASGLALPFKESSFDAATSSDAFCWLADKLSVLRAVRHVLKPGASFCQFVIANTSELTETDRELLAQRQGNDYVEAPAPYDRMMEEAGFVEVEIEDVTRQYAQTTIDWKRAWEDESESLVRLVGEDDYRRKIRNRELDIAFIEQGLLSRYRVFGTKAWFGNKRAARVKIAGFG